jgi:hypothetical protein
MPLTLEQIQAILKLIDESSCEEFHLETDGLKLVVRKGGAGDSPAAGDSRPSSREPARAAPVPPARVPEPAPEAW